MRTAFFRRQQKRKGVRALRWALIVMLLVLPAAMPDVGRAQTSAYLLGPGDVLEVSVWGYPDLTRVVEVRPDGKITVPVAGTVTAAGLPVEALTRALSRAYTQYIINPQVTVIVKEFRKIQVAVLGEVQRPGTYSLPPSARLLDLISAAGGIKEAALREGQLLRPGVPPVMVNLERLLAGDSTMNLPLQGGETLVVPEDLVNLVSVLGEVAKPGRYRLKGEMRVLDVLLLAGGLTERASVTQARVMRPSQGSQPLHLEGLLLHQQMSRNIVLLPGDTLFIPEETNNKIYVLGDVNHPGVFVLRGEVTLLQAVAMAGGPVQRGVGTAKTINLVRRNGLPDRALASAAKFEPLTNGGAVLTVDLQALTRGADIGRDVIVHPGDVVVVPQTGLSGIAVILSILSGILGAFR